MTQLRDAIAKMPVLRREAAITPRSSGAASQRAEGDQPAALELALSSETEVLRSDWFGERWVEILDHGPDAVDLTYSRDGMPLLVEHDRFGGTGQVGLLEDVRVDSDRVLRARMRFSRGARGQEVEQDIRDGIRKNASIGYRVLEVVLERQDKKTNVDYYRVTRWQPVEGSIVAVPADITVGVGRAGEGTPVPMPVPIPAAPKAEERTMEGQDTTRAAPSGAAAAPPAPVVAVTQRGGSEPVALRIAELASEHGFSDRTAALLRDHTEVRTAAEQILGWVKDRAKSPPTPTPPVELSPQEAQRYSYVRAIAAQCQDQGFDLGLKVDTGFEREVAKALELKLPPEFKRHGGGILVATRLRRPSEADLAVRAGLDSATSTKGAELKFVQAGEFIDALTARMRVKMLGARLLSGLTGPVTFPKQTGRATFAWMAENPSSDAAESELSLGTVALAIKTLIGSTFFSRQLLVSALSASIDAERMVNDDLVIGCALALDSAGIQGTGANNQPRGIINTSGIGSVAIGTNGGVPTYAHQVDLESAVATANADIDVLGFLSTPGIRGVLRKTLEFAAAGARTIWTGGQEGDVLGYRALTSTQVPSTLTKGTSSDCHAEIYGAWSQLLYGEWGTMEMVVDPYSRKRRGMIDVTCFHMADCVVRHPAAFAAILDARLA